MARFITLKDVHSNELKYESSDDKLIHNPSSMSESMLRRHMFRYPINYHKKLFTIASYEHGHYLIYDNHYVVAFTVIRD